MRLLVFKTLEVREQRLYHVLLAWPQPTGGVRTEHRYVFGAAPEPARRAVADLYARLPQTERPDCTVRSVSIGMPAEWFEPAEARGDARPSVPSLGNFLRAGESTNGGGVASNPVPHRSPWVPAADSLPARKLLFCGDGAALGFGLLLLGFVLVLVVLLVVDELHDWFWGAWL